LARAFPIRSAAMTELQFYSFCASPLGDLLLVCNQTALTGVHFVGEKYYPGTAPGWRESAEQPPLRAARLQLEQYFAGDRQRFELALGASGTPFQKRVWQALLEIPYGRTASYSELALWIGLSKAVRAVGAANARNPISIIVPCHRVIGADASLTGYAGGLHRKRALLVLEGSLPPDLLTGVAAAPTCVEQGTFTDTRR